MPVDPVPKKISPLHTTEKRFSISVWKGRSMQEFTERSSSGYTSNRDSDPFCVFSSTSADTLHPHHSNAIPGCPPEASPFCRSNELCAWAWLFLRPGLCNTAAKYSKTYEQLIADALRIDAPASDMTFFITTCRRGKTIGIICGVQEGWLTHYSNNWWAWHNSGVDRIWQLWSMWTDDKTPVSRRYWALCHAIHWPRTAHVHLPTLATTITGPAAAHHHVCCHIRSTSSATYNCKQEETAFTGSRDTAGS